MNGKYPQYYLHKDGFGNGTAYVVRTGITDAAMVSWRDSNRNFTWSAMEDRLVVNGVWREVTAEDAHRELERLLEMHSSLPSQTVIVHGLHMKIGDYYFGLPPKVEGVWAMWDDVPQESRLPDYVGYVRKVDIENPDQRLMKLKFWMYYGHIPKIGQCVKSPPVLEPDKKYIITQLSGKPWIYKFSAEGYSSDIGKRTMLHWFVSATGDEVVSFTRGRIGDKVED